MPAFRAKTMLVGSTGTTRKYTVPATAAAGDAILIWAYIETTGVTFSVAGGGWTKIAQTKQTSEGWEACAFILPNWNGSTTEYTLEWGGASKRNSGGIEAIKEADLSSPLHAQSGANFKENASSKEGKVDGLTTTVNECLLLTAVFNDSGISTSPATGWTEDGDQADSPELCHKNELVNAGSQAAVTHTLASAAINLTMMVAIQPPQAAQGMAMLL